MTAPNFGGGQPAPQQGGFQQMQPPQFQPQQQQQMQVPQQQTQQSGQQGFQPFQQPQQFVPQTQVQQVSDQSQTWAPPPMPQAPPQQMMIGPNGQPVPYQPQPNQPNLTWQQQAQVTPPNQNFAPAPPQQQFAPQQAPQQNAAQIVMDRQGRLAGPGVPRELQGRTLNEALSMYNIVRDGYAQTQLMQPQQVQQQQQGVPPAQQVNAQGQPANFWADPVGTIKQVVQEQMAPMTQQSQQAAVVNARNQVAQAYPQFAQVEGEVIESLKGLDMGTLSNPRAWETAMAAVVGRKTLQGQPMQQGGQQVQQNFQPNFQQAPQQNFQPQQPQQQQFQAPQQYQPYQAPPIGSFFTEQPTSTQSQMSVAPQLSAAQQITARKFGLTDQQYLQGMGVSA